MKLHTTLVHEITHLHIRNVDRTSSTIPLRSMVIVEDSKILVHLRESSEGLILECSNKLFRDPDSQLQSLTLVNDGEDKSIFVTCNDRAIIIPVTRITKLLKTPPEFKIGILADDSQGLGSCSIAYSTAFAHDIEQLDSVQML